MSTEEKAAQPQTHTPQDAELRQRMAKHLTALVFDQVDNNGDWLIHPEYTEGLVDAALSDWRREFEAVNKELLEALEVTSKALRSAITAALDPNLYSSKTEWKAAIDSNVALVNSSAAIAKARGIRGQ